MVYKQFLDVDNSSSSVHKSTSNSNDDSCTENDSSKPIGEEVSNEQKG